MELTIAADVNLGTATIENVENVVVTRTGINHIDMSATEVDTLTVNGAAGNINNLLS